MKTVSHSENCQNSPAFAVWNHTIIKICVMRVGQQKTNQNIKNFQIPNHFSLCVKALPSRMLQNLLSALSRSISEQYSHVRGKSTVRSRDHSTARKLNSREYVMLQFAASNNKQSVHPKHGIISKQTTIRCNLLLWRPFFCPQNKGGYSLLYISHKAINFGGIWVSQWLDFDS